MIKHGIFIKTDDEGRVAYVKPTERALVDGNSARIAYVNAPFRDFSKCRKKRSSTLSIKS